MIEDIQPAFAADAAALNPGLLEAADETSGSGGADLWSAAPDTAELVALIARIQREDAAALGALYDRTSGRVYGLALRIVRAPAAAEEIVEDVFFQIWQQAARYDPARGRPLAWMLTIARSRALDHLRRADPATLHPEPEILMRPDDADEAALNPQNLLSACRNHALLHAALAALDPLPRQLLALVFFRGLTHEEVAEQAGLPLGTVKSHVRRALLSLRGTLAATMDRSLT